MTTAMTEGQRTLSNAVAEEIRAMMARRRMSGRELANALGVSPAWVSYRLVGKQPIDLNDLAAIAAVLKVSIISLIPEDQRAAIAPYLPLTEEPIRNPSRPPDNRPSGHPAAHRQGGSRRTVRLPRPAAPSED